MKAKSVFKKAAEEAGWKEVHVLEEEMLLVYNHIFIELKSESINSDL